MKTQTLKNTSTRRAIRICAIPFAALLAVSASAADLTWDNGASTGLWNTTDANFGGLWTDGNTAVFGGTASSTIDISPAGRSATGVKFNVGGDNITGSGGSLTLTGTPVITVNDGLSAQISAVLAGGAAFALESNSVSGAVGSGGTLTTTGVETITAGGFTVGGASSGNTWNLNGGGTVANGTGIRKIYIGSVNESSGLTTTGNNRVFISTAGSSGSPSFNVSGNGGRVTVGYASSGNSLTVDSGAYVAQTTGGGTNTWELGVIAGANNNSMTVTGTNSSVVFGSNQFMNVGVAGNGNSVVVSAGGFFKTGRLGAGTNGGKNNFIQVTGTGSTLTVNTSSQPIIQIGLINGSTGNYIKIDSGGTFNTGTGAFSRGYVVGAVTGADNNYVLVTDSGSSFTVTEAQPLSFGGTAGVNNASHVITDSSAAGNHFDVVSGASTVQNSVYMMGTNSVFKLGDGTGISTATVNNSTGSAIYGAGITLYSSGTSMKFNSGRLIAGSGVGASGSLIKGGPSTSGTVQFDGPAYIDITSGQNNTITAPITGIGSLTKEGLGTLTISGTTPSYTGDTTVTLGTLNIAAGSGGFLADTSTVTIGSSSVFGLNWTGAFDNVAALYIAGSPVTGSWGATGSGAANIDDTHFTGTGVINVAGVPEPGTAVSLLGGLGMLLGLRRRRA